MEIVSPVILADSHWPSVIDRFWATLSEHFDFRRDTSCGFHVQISPATGSYSISQLRIMAKAVIFWGPATARCAPSSRQGRILDFCKSNIRDVPCFEPLSTYGPLCGLQHAYEHIDSVNRDGIVDYLCPDKYCAWNFKPSYLLRDATMPTRFREPLTTEPLQWHVKGLHVKILCALLA